MKMDTIQEVTNRSRQMANSGTMRRGDKLDLIRILLAIVLPPAGVFLQVGIGLHFWVNILLTLLGYVPGIIHAVWVILKK
jgi:uncharacterized membrane protein YqaE (UPF0057 family)